MHPPERVPARLGLAFPLVCGCSFGLRCAGLTCRPISFICGDRPEGELEVVMVDTGINLRNSLLKLLVLCCLLVQVGRAHAVGIKIGDGEVWAKLGLLLQARADFIDQAAPDGRSMDTDLYLRRLRILFWGQLNDKVNFFVQTDNPNLGKQGDFSSRTFIQDAWVELNLLAGLQVDAGMLLVPFSHHGMQGAISLHTVDYHSAVVRYPSGSNLVWRDYGVMARGLVFDGLLEYRLAILNGVHGGSEDPRNPHDLPRLAGRLTVNVFEAEGGPGVGGFYYDGLYLRTGDSGVVSSRKILSMGVSFDWQPDLNVSFDEAGQISGRSDYLALAADLFFDLPLTGDGRLGTTGQVDFYYYDHGRLGSYSDGSPASFYSGESGCATCTSGLGLAAEAGLRYGAWEVLGLLDWFSARDTPGDQGDLLAIAGGINWWWRGHATSIKLQAGATSKDGGDWGFSGRLQIQLLF
ncbi:MAG: hypothetical protein D6806_02530 [Deltaproteobacteria bacterium]|nr:MAG: hypothetical protein D6806_02530 [Deltaproteobacteria bacterium]